MTNEAYNFSPQVPRKGFEALGPHMNVVNGQVENMMRQGG